MKNPLSNVFPHKPNQTVPSALQAMRNWEEEMQNWFRKGALNWPIEYEGIDFSPACHISETAKEYRLEFDLPGIKKEDVRIELEDNRLTVSGRRKGHKEEKDERHFLNETYEGSFMRTFNLPTYVDDDKVDAHFEDGVLTVKVMKSTSSKAKTIKIA